MVRMCFPLSVCSGRLTSRSNSDMVAEIDQGKLKKNTDKLLEGSNEVSQRLANIEHFLGMSHFAASKPSLSRVSTHAERQSIMDAGTSIQDKRTSNAQVDAARTFLFERVLKASRVYRRVKRDSERFSFCSSVAPSHAWTALSEWSLSDISMISVIALPLDPASVPNAQRYTFVTDPTQIFGYRATPDPSIHINDWDWLDPFHPHLLNPRAVSQLNPTTHPSQAQQLRNLQGEWHVDESEPTPSITLRLVLVGAPEADINGFVSLVCCPSRGIEIFPHTY